MTTNAAPNHTGESRPTRATTAAPPSEVWRRLSIQSAPGRKLPSGLDATWNAAAGRIGALFRRRARYFDEAATVVAMESRYVDLTDARLREALARVQALVRRGRAQRPDVLEAFALVREVATRTLGLRPHPEQVAAGLVVHDGCVAEMATGEGKTLAVSMPTVIAGWRGRGCHVLTFNNYLAARDAESTAAIYEYCGLTVEAIEQEMPPDERRKAYAADVTYCTNQDVAADFLRDRLAMGRRTRLAASMLAGLVDGEAAGTGGLVMRSLATAIVDEADSILIDEAVTPLIISGEAPNSQQAEAYRIAARLAGELKAVVDFTVDHRYREVTLTAAGKSTLRTATRHLRGLWSGARRSEELVTQALTARELFIRDQQYVVEDDAVVIVDQSTGRLMPDRTWRAGLHQAVEAKEGLEVNAPRETLARISFQRFFRMYGQLAGMTGTAWEARNELWQIYGLATVVIPTHRPCLRVQAPDRVFLSDETRSAAVLEEIRTVHAEGRPILIGTRGVESSERLSRRLTSAGLPHDVLNAVRHAEEAAIVARAGGRGRITVATNMAGRGTDIKLGPGVRELGGLHVIAVERHESARVDRQLFGRSARQGDPGSAVSFVSLEDEICQRYAPPSLRRMLAGSPSVGAARSAVVTAQARAQRHGVRLRRAVLHSDDWLDRFLGFAGV